MAVTRLDLAMGRARAAAAICALTVAATAAASTSQLAAAQRSPPTALDLAGALLEPPVFANPSWSRRLWETEKAAGPRTAALLAQAPAVQVRFQRYPTYRMLQQHRRDLAKQLNRPTQVSLMAGAAAALLAVAQMLHSVHRNRSRRLLLKDAGGESDLSVLFQALALLPDSAVPTVLRYVQSKFGPQEIRLKAPMARIPRRGRVGGTNDQKTWRGYGPFIAAASRAAGAASGARRTRGRRENRPAAPPIRVARERRSR